MKKLLFLTLILLVFSCTNKDESKGLHLSKQEPYLAKIEDTVISQADFEKKMDSLPEDLQKRFEGSIGKEKFLNSIIQTELLYKDALKKGLDRDSEYIKKFEDFKKITLIGMLLRKEIKVSDQEVKDYYEKNKYKYPDIEFEKLRDVISQNLIVEKNKEVFDSYIENLKKHHTIEINYSEVRKLE